MVWLRALLPGLVAAGVTMMLTPAVAQLAVRLRAVDEPGGRRRQSRSTPRLGGIAILTGILIALVPSLPLLTRGAASRSVSPTETLWLLVATLIIFAVGLVDDIRQLGPFQKLFFQILAASIVVAMGWQFSNVRLPWDTGGTYVGAVAPLLSLLWIVGVTNAVNFIDGLDGLASGIVAIIASSLLVLAILQRSPEVVVATSCVVGACLGFLRHNWNPARIYMGDSGSLTLGFILATVSLHSSVKASATVALLVPILALGLPVLDTLLVMVYRFLKGHARMNRIARMFHADRKHLHHLLLETHGKRSRALWTLYALALAFCLMALLVATSHSLWLGMAFLGVEFCAVLLIRAAGFRAEARRLAAKRLIGIDAGEGAVGSLEPLPAAEAEAIESALEGADTAIK
jgi:UDP-GlcNAc:undecaprenyl-phosphate GlcNAc-1-phosphate transferase